MQTIKKRIYKWTKLYNILEENLLKLVKGSYHQVLWETTLSVKKNVKFGKINILME